MYKKLRWKFMWLSTGVLLLVIMLVVMVVYWITSSVVVTQTRVLMNLILENGGDLPTESEFDAGQEAFLALNAESIHEARYFSVVLQSGEAKVVTMRLMGVSAEEAVDMAETAALRRSSYGRLMDWDGRRLHYGRREEADGSTLIVFLDSNSRSGLLRLAVSYMAALWLVVLLLYVLIMNRYSRKLVKPFVENDEKQKRFITNASHELKTPLAVISANTEMTEVLGGRSKWTESTRRQVTRMQTLVEELVVLTRLDEMKELEHSDVDFSDLAAEAAESYRGVAESSGRRFESDIAPDVHVKADRRALQQIASILLDNASKYCDEGGDIIVTLTQKGRGARLTVTNTCADAKNVDTGRFFERFYRADESHNSAQSGFGIGLSMAREMAERMKGRLKVGAAGDIITFTLDI